MEFDNKYSLPKPNGATDYLDSPVIAGLMILTEHPLSYLINSSEYVKEGKYWRYPYNTELDFSRDQSLPLVAALWKQGYKYLVDKSFIVGKDIFSPSQNGHIARCKGEKPSWFQEQWLWLDILWYSTDEVGIDVETNQLLCMFIVAGPKWVKRYVRFNPDWRESIRDYWCKWRNEIELAEHIIKYVEGLC